MKVIPIPSLKDNFSYLLICPKTGEAGVVDPSDTAPVISEIKKQGCRLTSILNTHHHWDHVQGNAELISAYPNLKVRGHRSDQSRIPGLNSPLDHEEVFTLGAMQVSVLYNPGHTLGAISYVVEDSVFTGDTLFGGGCGRLFEGTAKMMHESLNTVIGGLPPQTKVYFGHEYTESNLSFALTVEPGNQELHSRMEALKKTLAQGLHSTPSTLELEKRTNPFLRVDRPEIVASVKKAEPKNNGSPLSVFTALREMKNKF